MQDMSSCQSSATYQIPAEIWLQIVGDDARVWNKLVRAVPWIHKMIPFDVLRERFVGSTRCRDFLNAKLICMPTLCGQIHTVDVQPFSDLENRMPYLSEGQRTHIYFDRDDINMSIHVNYGALADYNGAPAIDISVTDSNPLPWTHLTIHAKNGYPYCQDGPAVVYSAALYDHVEITGDDFEGLGEGYDDDLVLFEVVEVYADELPSARLELDPNVLSIGMDARPIIEHDDPKVAEFIKNAHIKKIRILNLKRRSGCLIDLDISARQMTITTYNIKKREPHMFDQPHTVDAKFRPFEAKTDIKKMTKTNSTDLLTYFALGWLNFNIYGGIDDVIETINEFL